MRTMTKRALAAAAIAVAPCLASASTASAAGGTWLPASPSTLTGSSVHSQGGRYDGSLSEHGSAMPDPATGSTARSDLAAIQVGGPPGRGVRTGNGSAGVQDEGLVAGGAAAFVLGAGTMVFARRHLTAVNR